MDVEGRGALIRDLSTLLVASVAIFVVDVLSPPTLNVSIAYAGLVLFAARPAQARAAYLCGAIATLLTGTDLALEGQLTLALSDALLSSLLSVTLTWMIVLIGTTRAISHRASVRFTEVPSASAAVAE